MINADGYKFCGQFVTARFYNYTYPIGSLSNRILVYPTWETLQFLGSKHALHSKSSRFEEREALSVAIVAAMQPPILV